MRHRIRVERPVAGEGFGSAGLGNWTKVIECWADVQDVLPSNAERDERLAEGSNTSTRTSRVRLSYRSGLDSNMRILVGRNLKGADGEPYWKTDRVMQIVTVPAEIGRRDGLEFMAEDYRPAGNAA